VKSIIKILPIIIFHSIISFAQNTDQSNTKFTEDSLKIKASTSSLIHMQLKFQEFDLHREFNSLKSRISIDGDPQTVWLRTSIAISNPEISDHKFSPHFLSPLEKKYYEDSKFDPIKSILGMAQVGAVGYLAYKHIKKYGFLK
jgi:hypothetical protein